MNRHLFNFLSFFLLLLLTSCTSTKPLADSAAANIEFTILQINDVYEIAPLENGKAGGLARVATVKKDLMKENPNTIATLSGDFLSPSLYANLKLPDGERIAGLQMVETLNAMGLDYATFGNHEFDLKTADLLQKRIHQSRFEYTVCNASRADGGQIRPFVQNIQGQERPIPEYLIREFSNAQGDKMKVGIMGVVLPFNQQPYVHYEPVTEQFQKTYQNLEPQVDVVIALTHLNEVEDIALAEAVPGVLIFLGGHDHVHMSHYVENTVITKADANAKTVYIHRVTFNPQSKMAAVRTSLQYINDSIKDDPGTQLVVEKWQNNLYEIMRESGYQPDEVLMTTQVPLECKESAIRSRPTNYGQLSVSAMESAWSGADVYLLNSGSMRVDDDISGAITQFDVLRTFPFGGGICQMALPGNVLQKMLEIGLLQNRGEGGYFQIKDVEQRNGQWLLKGEAIEVSKKYNVVLPTFVAEGNEANLGLLKDFPKAYKEDLNSPGKSLKNDIRDIVMAYMRQL